MKHLVVVLLLSYGSWQSSSAHLPSINWRWIRPENAITVESQCSECNRKVGGETIHRVIWVNLWVIFYSKKENMENEGIKNHINDKKCYELNLPELPKKKKKKITPGPQHSCWLSRLWANRHQAVLGATQCLVEPGPLPPPVFLSPRVWVYD